MNTLATQNWTTPTSKRIILVARLLLGVILIASVIVRVVAPNAVAQTTGFGPDATAWLDTMAATGYLEAFVYLTELAVGPALISGYFVPLALLVFAPIHLNITLFHLFLDLQPIRIGQIFVMGGTHLLLAYAYWDAFRPIFHPHTARPWRFGRINLVLLARVLLGLAFLIPGAAKLVVPDQLSQGVMLIDGMKATGYLYPLLGITEVIVGLLLLLNRFVPLAIVMAAPVIVNIFAFHMFEEVAGLPVGMALVALFGMVVWAYWSVFRPKLLAPN